jgi:hypothetical protein
MTAAQRAAAAAVLRRKRARIEVLTAQARLAEIHERQLRGENRPGDGPAIEDLCRTIRKGDDR